MDKYENVIENHFGDILHFKELKGNNCYYYNYDHLDEDITIRIEIPNNFPEQLPNIYINNYEYLKSFFSHVENDGKICYFSSDNILFDTAKTEQLLVECINKVLAIVSTWGTREMIDDLRNEFLSYWSYLCSRSWNIFTSYSVLGDSIQECEIIRSKSFNFLFHKNDSKKEEVLEVVLGKNFDESNLKKERALYLPLRDNNDVVPPNPKKELKIEDIKIMIEGNLSSSVKRQYRKWLKKTEKSFWLFIGIPISSHNNIIIGIFVKNYSHNNPLKKNNHSSKVYPLFIKRADSHYQISRTSQNYSLDKAKIAIIGLGSVGSVVANHFSKMGVNSLLLVDDDRLEVENISRHLLGFESLSKGYRLKVEALQEYIEKQNPNLDVNVESLTFQKMVEIDPASFNDIDIIVSCTGDTMTNIYINNFFKDTNKSLVFGWLDPYGIGSHCLITNGINDGCYGCLNYGREGLCSNRASFARSGQNFLKNLASCGSAFIPYNYIASNTTANLVCEGVLRVIEGEATDDNMLMSSIGRTNQFLKDGYELSQRYKVCIEDSKKLETNSIVSEYCPHCGDIS